MPVTFEPTSEEKKYETKAFNLHTGKNIRKIVEMVFDLSI